MVGVIVFAGVLLLVLANAHLVYVAMTSQPECVAHSEMSEGATIPFRAAKPSC